MIFFNWLVHVLRERCSQGRLNEDTEDKHMARLSEALWCFCHWSSKDLSKLTQKNPFLAKCLFKHLHVFMSTTTLDHGNDPIMMYDEILPVSPPSALPTQPSSLSYMQTAHPLRSLLLVLTKEEHNASLLQLLFFKAACKARLFADPCLMWPALWHPGACLAAQSGSLFAFLASSVSPKQWMVCLQL